MIDDTVPHAMTIVKDGGLWRSTCVCGWQSKLCRNKAAAERSKFFHLGPQVTVTLKRSRTPGLRLPGSRRLATYDSSAAGVLDAKDRITPAKRAKAKKRRAEAKVVKSVREICVERDGYCRYRRDETEKLPFQACQGLSQLAHLHEYRRSKTRGQAPEKRHQTAGCVMFCQKHHEAYDAHRLQIDGTVAGANGDLTYTVR